MRRAENCATCDARTSKRHGVAAHMLTGAGLEPVTVCPDCARRGILLVTPAAGHDARAVLRPYAAHFRRIAKPYELQEDGRSVGLLQAADILEAGRAVNLEEPAARPSGLLPKTSQTAPRKIVTVRKESSSSPRVSPKTFQEGARELGRLEHAILRVLIQRAPRPTNRRQLALQSGYSVDSGSFASGLALLRTRGLIAGPAGAMAVTDDGRKAAGPVEALPDGEELIAYWVERVGPCAGSILEIVTTEYPNGLDRDELAHRAGYSARSGSFASALAQLRTLALLDGFRASSELMSAVGREP